MSERPFFTAIALQGGFENDQGIWRFPVNAIYEIARREVVNVPSERRWEDDVNLG